MRVNPPEVVILEARLTKGDNAELLKSLSARHPDVSLILFAQPNDSLLWQQTQWFGACAYLTKPLEKDRVLKAVQLGVEKTQRLRAWARLQARKNTKSLRQRLNGLEALQKISRQVTSTLDLDSIFAEVVQAAVELTGAEKGSLLLLDEASGEIYMRAAYNFQEDFVRTFRVPIQDSLPGKILRSGRPLLLDAKTPHKIKTSYLVNTLMYVPMKVKDRVIGILGVDNRQSGQSFSDYHLALVTSLADYAAIAVENARLYLKSENERHKLETLLTNIQDAVIVLDADGRLLLMNNTAREAFDLEGDILPGARVEDIFQNQDLLDLIHKAGSSQPLHSEIVLANGRVLNAQASPIPDVGTAITMQDITPLKELDRIKSDFVNTVSHDLRSPLTAILGYVELLERVGPLNREQKIFVQRIQLSVKNITALINDLLDLGRIEAGFDARKEIVSMPEIIRWSVNEVSGRAAAKQQQLKVEVPAKLPSVLGIPVRLQQMVANLLSNAVKYTPAGGIITVRARGTNGQVIIQVEDTGNGIPSVDQPYIFDKFYRASNAPADVPGTGLGLAIVKSIVDSHNGRIWVESALNKGSVFTVVLPTIEETL